mmetsp:Transcript_50677/g.110162  ORF Transcript_50677/g.110162 Transcript_50677/m.110162 type:complete len:538 (+) Transcript_50677:82-1695(+)
MSSWGIVCFSVVVTMDACFATPAPRTWGRSYTASDIGKFMACDTTYDCPPRSANDDCSSNFVCHGQPGLKSCVCLDSVILRNQAAWKDQALHFTMQLHDKFGQPITGLEEHNVNLLYKGNDLTEGTVKFVFRGPDTTVAFNTLLLLDTSDSVMKPSHRHIFSSLVTAAKEFTNSLSSSRKSYVAVYTFAGSRELLEVCDFTADQAKLSRSLDEENLLKTVLEWEARDSGATDLHGSAARAARIVMRRALQNGPQIAGNLFVFTDGADTADRMQLPELEAVLDNMPISRFLITLTTSGTPAATAQVRGVLGRDGFYDAKSTDDLLFGFSLLRAEAQARQECTISASVCPPARQGMQQVTVQVRISGLVLKPHMIINYVAAESDSDCATSKRSVCDDTCGLDEATNLYCGECREVVVEAKPIEAYVSKGASFLLTTVGPGAPVTAFKLTKGQDIGMDLFAGNRHVQNFNQLRINEAAIFPQPFNNFSLVIYAKAAASTVGFKLLQNWVQSPGDVGQAGFVAVDGLVIMFIAAVIQFLLQ